MVCTFTCNERYFSILIEDSNVMSEGPTEETPEWQTVREQMTFCFTYVIR